jgi:hypothetical protein
MPPSARRARSALAAKASTGSARGFQHGLGTGWTLTGRPPPPGELAGARPSP